tara:strand:- start:475 stop:582 length:108 start_codon:yes stop_codon:yes gene_type:complete
LEDCDVKEVDEVEDDDEVVLEEVVKEMEDCGTQLG